MHHPARADAQPARLVGVPAPALMRATRELRQLHTAWTRAGLTSDQLATLAGRVFGSSVTQPPDPAATLSTDQAADYLGMSRSVVLRRHRTGALPALVDSHRARLRFRREDLDAYLAGASRPDLDRLPPGLRRVVLALLAGATQAEAAAQLGLDPSYLARQVRAAITRTGTTVRPRAGADQVRELYGHHATV